MPTAPVESGPRRLYFAKEDLQPPLPTKANDPTIVATKTDAIVLVPCWVLTIIMLVSVVSLFAWASYQGWQAKQWDVLLLSASTCVLMGYHYVVGNLTLDEKEKITHYTSWGCCIILSTCTMMWGTYLLVRDEPESFRMFMASVLAMVSFVIHQLIAEKIGLKLDV
jgi:hypothetical protein